MQKMHTKQYNKYIRYIYVQDTRVYVCTIIGRHEAIYHFLIAEFYQVFNFVMLAKFIIYAVNYNRVTFAQ